MKTAEEIEKHFQKSCESRDAFWNNIGDLDSDVIAHLINPAFMGGPRWPSLRQAFITVRCPTTTIIGSDGLSDPFDDPDEVEEDDSPNGFGLEFYAETPGNIEDVKSSWVFDLVYQISQNAADVGDLRWTLRDYQYLTMELYDVRVPEEFNGPEGRTGIFIGLPSKTVPSQCACSLESIDIVNVKLLTQAELAYAAKAGREGRDRLAKLFMEQGNPTYSDLNRQSVI